MDGEAVAASNTLSHPFVRTRGRNLSAFVLFDYIDSDTDLRRQKLSEDRLRVARAGLVYDFVDRYEGINLFFLQASRGLGILGATGGDDPVSRPGGGSGFTKFELSAFRLQRLGAGWNVRFQASGQYSFDRLLAPEEFGFGGEEFGRGYDPSDH